MPPGRPMNPLALRALTIWKTKLAKKRPSSPKTLASSSRHGSRGTIFMLTEPPFRLSNSIMPILGGNAVVDVRPLSIRLTSRRQDAPNTPLREHTR